MKSRGNVKSVFMMIILCMSLAGCSPDKDSAEVQTSPSAEAASAAGTEAAEAAPLQSPGIQNVTFHSKALDQDMRLSIYLPKGYSTEQHYPVLYLVHGYGGKETDMIEGLGIHLNAERLTQAGQIDPLIIVSPQMDNSYGLNSSPVYAVNDPGDPLTTYNGMYEDYLVKDVVGYVDSHFSTLAERDKRYIGGISMGGFVSLHTALLHTDVYSRVGGHSPALFLDDWSAVGGENGLIRFLYPTEAQRQERDPLIFAKDMDLSDLAVYLDCGQEDSYRFYEGAEQLNTLLKDKGVQTEYHVRAGKHDGEYWRSHLDEYLIFYAGRTN
ncbi:alpha/beta hydrolase [Paenibacillus borealis]|uniref:alpha/beta hydrolase n=1 Tax=Paenibacillus borealis TaxID=160799 RepID=UPI000693B907|nr:alpha/beta hydrolase-fold protein [Paenibacillus borealis]